jgi:hypothetical protein
LPATAAGGAAAALLTASELPPILWARLPALRLLVILLPYSAVPGRRYRPGAAAATCIAEHWRISLRAWSDNDIIIRARQWVTVVPDYEGAWE